MIYSDQQSMESLYEYFHSLSFSWNVIYLSGRK